MDGGRLIAPVAVAGLVGAARVQEAGAPVSGPVVAVDGWALGAFAGYLLILVGIGIASSRFSSRGMGEFFVGGRKMNRLVVALSAVVSGRSAWLLLGVTGMAYSTGASALWAVAGYTAVELLLFLTLARRLRRFSEVHDCVTVPDFFAARFGDEDGRLRMVLAGVILLFMVGYVAAQFTAGGKAVGASFGLGTQAGVLLTAAIVLGYTVVGGFLAVSLTDSLQAVFMLFGLLVVPALAVSDAGGWGAVVTELAAYDPSFTDPLALGFGAWLGLVGIGLGSPGNPHIIVRYMSIDDERQLRWAGFVGTFWNVLMGAGAILIGLVGRVYVPTVEALPAADTENLYPVLAQEHLHPVLFGIVVASIFAAIMSTADSQLLVAASAVARDLYEKVLRAGEEVAERTLVRISRGVVAVLVVASVGLAMTAEELVFWLVLFAWAGLGAALGPPTILALYWARTTRAGVLAGLITGTVVTVAGYRTLSDRLYELIPAFLLSALATWGVSLATQPPADAREMIEAAKPHLSI